MLMWLSPLFLLIQCNSIGEADLANYPRTLQEDCELLRDKHVDIVFAPSAKEMYPNGMENQTIVEVPVLSSVLEGASRPGHFRGVTTVCK